jgi:hypothetical protein
MVWQRLAGATVPFLKDPSGFVAAWIIVPFVRERKRGVLLPGTQNKHE